MFHADSCHVRGVAGRGQDVASEHRGECGGGEHRGGPKIMGFTGKTRDFAQEDDEDGNIL